MTLDMTMHVLRNTFDRGQTETVLFCFDVKLNLHQDNNSVSQGQLCQFQYVCQDIRVRCVALEKCQGLGVRCT